MSYLSTISTQFADSGSIDAFSRMRVSTPTNLFDAQFTYNDAALIYEKKVVGTGASISHDANDRCMKMVFSGTTNGQAYMQSYEYIPYQPGKSQLAFITFNMVETNENTKKFVGLSDYEGTGIIGEGNGLEFQLNGTTKQVVIYSDTGFGDETITQSNWNLDKLDGTGISGITLDITKTQIFVIDFQALYVGRVRVGFDIDGKVYYVHEFNHANRNIAAAASPYIQYASLPVRAGMTCTSSATTEMKFICAAVISEGGDPTPKGYIFSKEGTATATNGSRTHVLSVRPKTTFNGIKNRIHFELDSITTFVTGNYPIFWELCIGQAITGGAYSDVNSLYSGFEANPTATINLTPALVIASGYCAGGAGSKDSGQTVRINSKYPITLDMAGIHRALGTLSVIATGLGGNTACRACLQWREIR